MVKKEILLLIFLAVALGLAMAIFLPQTIQYTAAPQMRREMNRQLSSSDAEPQKPHADVMEMIEQNRDNAEMLIQIGNILFDRHKYESARIAYQAALEHKPNDPDLLTDLGICYRNLGDPEKGVEMMRLAAQADPRHALSRLNLGIILQGDLNDSIGALAYYKEFLAIAPQHSHAEMVRQRIAEIERIIEGK